MLATTRSPISLIIPNPLASIPLLMGLYFRVFLSTPLARFPIAFSCARFRLHVVDLDPTSISSGGWLEDTSLVEKYQISEEAYNKRQGMSPEKALFFFFFFFFEFLWKVICAYVKISVFNAISALQIEFIRHVLLMLRFLYC